MLHVGCGVLGGQGRLGTLFHSLLDLVAANPVPWTARRSNQSILKEISPGCSLEGLMLKLQLQYFGHLMRRVDSLEKSLMLGKIEGKHQYFGHLMLRVDSLEKTLMLGWIGAGGEGDDRG